MEISLRSAIESADEPFGIRTGVVAGKASLVKASKADIHAQRSIGDSGLILLKKSL